MKAEDSQNPSNQGKALGMTRLSQESWQCYTALPSILMGDKVCGCPGSCATASKFPKRPPLQGTHLLAQDFMVSTTNTSCKVETVSFTCGVTKEISKLQFCSTPGTSWGTGQLGAEFGLSL